MTTEYVRWNSEWVPIAATAGPEVVTSFEDGSFAEWSEDTAAFQIDQTLPIYDGLFSLKGGDVADSGGGTALLLSTSGLPTYPERGDTVRLDLQANTSGAEPGFVFGAQDAENHYFFRLNQPSDTLELYKRDGGAASLLDSTAYTFSEDTHYIAEVDWASDDTITVRVYDDGLSELVSASGTDATFSDQTGIGIYQSGNSGNTATWDRVRII